MKPETKKSLIELLSEYWKKADIIRQSMPNDYQYESQAFRISRSNDVLHVIFNGTRWSLMDERVTVPHNCTEYELNGLITALEREFMTIMDNIIKHKKISIYKLETQIKELQDETKQYNYPPVRIPDIGEKH